MTIGFFFNPEILIFNEKLPHYDMGKPKKRWIIIFTVLVVLQLLSLLTSTNTFSTDEAATIDKADTAWMIVATAFVLFMTPGLSFFYGGMVN